MRKILFVSSFHPDGAGNIGAGEAISGDSIRRLCSTGAEVHVLCVAPDYQRANQLLVEACASYEIVQHSPKQSLLAISKNVFNGALFAPWLFTRVSSRAIMALKKTIDEIQPDEVWLDFPSSLGFVRYIQAPRIVYFAHDILSQKIRRSPFKFFLAPFVSRIERRLLEPLSRLIVLSDKDSRLARDLGFSKEIDIWAPSRPRVGSVDNSTAIDVITAQFGKGPNMVFFGHMGRPENHWSMVVFIVAHYWKIRIAFPTVRLWIIGIKPRFTLKTLARIFPGVEIVGPVDDPSEAFSKSTLCIAPILFGAGVKIKVLQMLDAGATVVATPVGAEGISENSHLVIANWSDLSPIIVYALKQYFNTGA
jgi:hypothetical protein